MPVGWDQERPEAAPDDIDALEKALGRELPAEYRAFLLERDGGRPEDNDFAIT